MGRSTPKVVETPVELRSDPTQREFVLELPMRIQTSSKKKTALNLNIYRNLHHRSNNALKVKFKELAEKRLEGMPKLGRIRLHYSICPKSKRRLDILNVGSIVDKFFSDVLTESGIIDDDDFTHLDFVSFGFGGLAKNEHVLVTITEIEERTDMKLSMTAELSVEDVQAAVAAWVTAETGQEATADDVTVTPDGGASVTVGDAPADTTTAAAKPRAKRRTKAQIEADNKAAEEAKSDGADDTNVPDSSDSDGGGSDQDAEAQAEDSTEAAAEASEGGKPKNDSTESQDESSPTNGVEPKATTEPVTPKKKKSSIFAQ